MRFTYPDLDDPGAHPRSVRKAVAAQRDAAFRAYAEHHARLRPTLPPDLQWLCDFSLDDALIRSLTIWEAERRVRLEMIVGDLQRGYFTAVLVYTGVALDARQIEHLCLVAHVAGDAYWGAELERDETTDPPLYVHRICWHTDIVVERAVGSYRTLNVEFEIRSVGLTCHVTPRKRRTFRRKPDPITIVRDPNVIPGMETP